jgi:hypothetical protein
LRSRAFSPFAFRNSLTLLSFSFISSLSAMVFPW